MTKKEEMIARGIPEDRVDELFDLYLSDIRKLEDHYKGFAEECERLRASIAATINLLQNPDTLKRIVQYVNSAYYRDERASAEEREEQCQQK